MYLQFIYKINHAIYCHKMQDIEIYQLCKLKTKFSITNFTNIEIKLASSNRKIFVFYLM